MLKMVAITGEYYECVDIAVSYSIVNMNNIT